MSSNNINTLCRIDQAIRGLNDDGTDDSYVPAQSANGALERIEKSIKELDIKGIKSGLPKVTNADNGKVLQVKSGKWAKGEIDLSSKVGVIETTSENYIENYDTYKADTEHLYLIKSATNVKVKNETFTEANAKITVSGNSDKAYKAFDGALPLDGSSANSSSWYDNENTSTSATPWIAYEFDSSIIVDSFIVRYGVVAHSYGEGGNFTIDIQGSNDKETWTSLLEAAKTINITSSGATSSEWSDVDYTNDIVSTDTYKYVRLLFNQGMYSNPGQTVYVGEVQIAGIKALEEPENQIYYKGELYANTSAGGSAPSGPTRTTLFESPDGGGVWMDSAGKYLDLSDDIDNYDELEFIALTAEGDNNYYYTGSQKFIVSDLLEPRKDTATKGMLFRVLVYRSTGLDTSTLSVILVSQSAAETAKRTLYCNGATGIYGAAIHAIYGIKY